MRSLAYMDSAVGIVMDEVAKGPNADNTLFVLVGDHAFANNAQHRVSNFIGGVHDGYTWVPLIVAGPGIEQKIVTTPVSQVDIAPTVLDYLFLYGTSENFVGQSLLELEPPDGLCGGEYTIAFHAASKHRPVFAFRMGDMTMITDSGRILNTRMWYASSYRTNPFYYFAAFTWASSSSSFLLQLFCTSRIWRRRSR